jgi:serine/threonine protein kinase
MPDNIDGERQEPLSINVGDQLDSKYRIVKRLNGGAFGEVYLAVDELLGRQVAIKLLRDRDPNHQAELVHEMRSLDQLHHPGVVTFYHHFVKDELLFLVMEYCAGGSLRTKMRERQATQNCALQWVKELAETLHLLHGKGVVHHDIKPENILFASDGALKIGDFGVANRNMGTLPYLPPEMFLGEADSQDVRVDVYALGVMLVELLMNRNPFEGIGLLETFRAKIRHDFIPTGMERWLQDVAFKATHPTPELRFQSMKEFYEAIESKHVNYVFERSRVQAHALAAKAEKLLARKHTAAASKCIHQALYVSPDCVSALVAAGRYNLFVNRIAEAKHLFDQALSLNPRTNVQKELGWICLEVGNYSQAISMLTDHLQRNASNYEAFNLLLECFYRTERYEVGTQVAKLMIDESAPSDCFENNGILCGLLSGVRDETFLEQCRGKRKNPFISYNLEILEQDPDRLKTLALFENHRFGLPTRKENTITIEQGGCANELKEPIITIGRLENNRVHLPDTHVSRRHCAIVNYRDDVWIYDLGSTYGVFVDGNRVDRKAYLEGVHTVTLGQTELTLRSKRELLV